jgi:cell fate (sporulation/competence/biofilm development) regulator YlbF (YheA/YmcA/DUF963 family)
MRRLNEVNEQSDEIRILNVSKKLARAIIESTQFQRYEKASDSLRADKEAQRLLSDFRETQEMLQLKQSWGGSSDNDFEHIEKMREQLLLNSILREYFEAQEDMVLMLKELNIFISEKLGFDFANLTKPAGGCC